MGRTWKKTVAAALLISVAGGGVGGAGGVAKAADRPALYDDILTQEAGWISSLPFASGAIPTYSDPISNYGDKYKVVPYFTHFGLLGLLEKPENSQTVRNYMDWYFAHLNRSATSTTPAGSVYDYVVETDKITETPTGDFDSTDSYASTFLDVVRKYVEVTGDAAYAQQHKSDILLIADAMLSTQQADGLTWAKPSYPVKYLMDNTEVYLGLEAIEWLSGNVFGDEAAVASYRQRKEDVYDAIQGLWSDTRQTYAYAKMNDGSLLYPDWNSFYADATSQLFPIWTGILAPDSERALHLYNTFNEHHPGWPQLNKGDAFPWAIIAYTAALMGDRTRVDQFLASVKTAFIDQDHPWPWYVMESGVTMLAAAHAKGLPDSPAEWTMTNLPEGAVLTEEPYAVEGTSEGVASVEMTWTNEGTQRSKTFRTEPAGGSWRLSVDGLTNGSYRVEVTAKDRFANVVAAQQLRSSVSVAGENPIARAALVSDRDTLRRGESTTLTVFAYREDGTTPVDLSGASIDYETDRPELVSIDDHGVLTLNGMTREMQELHVWASFTQGYDLVKTDTLTLRVSHEALTMADEAMDRMSAWIADRQLDNGALTSDATGRQIKPAQANVGARGLLLRAETVPNVQRYLDWYTTHWNWGDRYGIYGSIDEFRLNEATGQWASEGGYESASPTIGTFITLLRRNFEKTGRFGLSQSNLDLLTGGIGIMRSQDADGLMWKLPDEPIKLLRANALTYQGMTDSVWLFRHYFEASGPADYFAGFADSLRNGIQTRLWNDAAGAYDLSVNGRGEIQAADWSKPEDAVAQLSPVYSGVISADSEKARTLYAKFNQAQPAWASDGSLGGFAPAAYAAALMGDQQRVTAYLGRLVTTVKRAGFPDGWTVEQAGYAMLAADAVRTMPASASVVIEKPEAGTPLSNGVSQQAKGSASGADQVRVELREKYGTYAYREDVAVQPNGKWHASLKNLKRDVSYELTVSALDAYGYPVYGASARTTFD
ncbi:hypothetical protein [Cohnella sp. REN36]|uniref:hypothetical protein n=1 Tax=Cohnella sp. REN36 TaxID=2887347 RepID=UPI001D147C80|nr:hypothetical protein [Cohnella sp. REN36]MCC3376576.1 hypothetical protein [Cohnella sp. REN36]